MRRHLVLVTSVALLALSSASIAQNNVQSFTPVTQEMLANPSADDWLMYSRTYDAQRFSPLKQITRQNVGQLREVFKKELGTGNQESIPIVHQGVLYLAAPGASVLAVDATTGATIWEHTRPTGASRTKAIAIYEDMVFYASPDGFFVALDARTGAVKWETKSSGNLTSGVIVADGKVLSGRACGTQRDNCYISAHDAELAKRRGASTPCRRRASRGTTHGEDRRPEGGWPPRGDWRAGTIRCGG